MRQISKLLFSSALLLLAQLPLTEQSVAQSVGADPRSAFSESIPFAGGYVHLEYLPKEKAVNVRSVNNDGSGIHSYIGIGWSYFTTNVVSAGGTKGKSSTDPLSTCLAAQGALIQAQFAAIAVLITSSTRGNPLSPNFYRTLEWVQTACQSVLPVSSAKPPSGPAKPNFGAVPPQAGG